jgi:hypothetical protein
MAWRTRVSTGGSVKLLAVAGGGNCVVVPLLFAPGQSPLFPLPGLYLLEIALVGLAGLAGLLSSKPADDRWDWVPWAAVGVLLAFVFLGAWTIGFFLIPALLAFLLAGFLSARRRGHRMGPLLEVCLAAALGQAALVLALVSWA